jgi:hypothetical protein
MNCSDDDSASDDSSDASMDSLEWQQQQKREQLLRYAQEEQREARRQGAQSSAAARPSAAAAAAVAQSSAARPSAAAAQSNPASPPLSRSVSAPAAAAPSPVAAPSRVSPPRSAAQRANAALSAQPKRTNNYPPADSAEIGDEQGKQIYRLDHWEYGLETNARLLRTSVRLSEILPGGEAGLGLFATKNFEEGETVGYLWGKFILQEEWNTLQTRQVDPSHRAGEEDYAGPVSQGINRVVTVPMQENGATLLLASQQCPMAYINQGHDAATNNVKIVFPAHAFDAEIDKPAYKYIKLVVETQDGRGIKLGDEFTTSYGWKASELAKLKTLYAAHVARLSKQRPTQLRTYDAIRAQYSAAAAMSSPGASSVVSEGSHDTNTSNESHRRRAALEGDRSYPIQAGDGKIEQKMYSCCKKMCYNLVSRIWVMQTRSVTRNIVVLF